MCAAFWNTQPVGAKEIDECSQNKDGISPEPLHLPEHLRWTEANNITQIAQFLQENYAENLDASFRLCYSEQFFEYLFADPSHRPCYSVGLMENGAMVGYLLAKEHTFVISQKARRVVSINFLCLAKKYRSLGLASVLIKEATRIANRNGIFRGVFTGKIDYGFAIGKATYCHLVLDPLTLLENKYVSDYPPGVVEYKMRASTREATQEDFPAILECYNTSVHKSTIHEQYTIDEFAYSFKTRKNVFYTLYNSEANEFASMFIVDTLSKQTGTTFSVAYLYYWHGSMKIIEDLACYARNQGFALLNVLNLGRNEEVIAEFNMLEGTGDLYYHLYNWKTGPVKPDQLNIILF